MGGEARRAILATGISILALATTPMAQAQTTAGQATNQDQPGTAPDSPTPEAASQDATPTGDIVVTARRRSESLNRVPVVVSVIGTQQIANNNANDLSKIGELTPTVIIGAYKSNGGGSIAIRGISSPANQAGFEQAVSVAIDGVQTSDGRIAQLGIFDVQQVEVLKGPQGPLYGTGALGGVLRLVPNKPELTTGAGMIRIGGSATQHGAPAGTVDAWVNVPLIADTLAVRAVAYRVGQGGWIDTDAGARDINHGVTSGGRVTVRAAVGANWTIDAQGVTQAARIADSQYSEKRDSLTRSARLP